MFVCRRSRLGIDGMHAFADMGCRMSQCMNDREAHLLAPEVSRRRLADLGTPGPDSQEIIAQLESDA